MKIKVCGVSNMADAVEISRAGADFIGVIFVPESPRRIGFAQAKALSGAKMSARLVGVFADAPVDDVLRAVDECGLYAVQLHGSENAGYIRAVGRSGARVWKTVWLSSRGDVSAAADIGCDMLVVDAVAGGLRGGTGRLADWDLARELAEMRDIFLAGGISFENAADAVSSVNPFGLDFNSSVEISPRKKDTDKISKYLKHIKNQNERV